MAEYKSEGKCSFCKGTFSKRAMTRHLKLCKQNNAVPITSSEKRNKQEMKTFHLVVEGRHSSAYWMHLEADGEATLHDLDRFLRDIWLECCGHMSAFTIGEETYISGEAEGPKSMYLALGDVLSPGLKFHYKYDFGTTTKLALRVVKEQTGVPGNESIYIMARNDALAIVCDSCEETATQICAQCIYSEGGAWFCDKCARAHECNEEMFLPVVNSPRVGMCGYTG